MVEGLYGFGYLVISNELHNTTEMDSFLETFSRHGPTVSSLSPNFPVKWFDIQLIEDRVLW
jgi:hypothetical protein